MYRVYIAFGASPLGYMKRLSMMISSLLLSALGENLAILSSVPNTLVIPGHSPRCVEDSFAAPHMRHVFSLRASAATKRLREEAAQEGGQIIQSTITNGVRNGLHRSVHSLIPFFRKAADNIGVYTSTSTRGAGAVRIWWPADEEFEEEETYAWSILTEANWNADR